MSDKKEAPAPRVGKGVPTVEKVLAKPMTQRGVEKKAGAKVKLKPSQVQMLEPQGYFKD